MARRAVYHHRKLNALDPDADDCPGSCDGPKRRDGFCDDCPVGDLVRGFREGAEEEIAAKCPPESLDWSFESLYDDVLSALRADSELRGRGYPAGSTAVEARVIDIVRAARTKAERVDAWNRAQEPKGK